MRRVKNPQLHFGEVNIADIELDARSRDDIPAILKGLQYIYTNDDARKKVFSTLTATLDPSVNTEVGRPGMVLWKIFVLATLKLGLNCDFDRLQELANHHNTVRKMLGHSGWKEQGLYDADIMRPHFIPTKQPVFSAHGNNAQRTFHMVGI